HPPLPAVWSTPPLSLFPPPPTPPPPPRPVLCISNPPPPSPPPPPPLTPVPPPPTPPPPHSLGPPPPPAHSQEAHTHTPPHPLPPQRLAELLEIKSQKSLKTAIQDLNTQYEASDRTFRIEQVAGGYQLLSLPKYGDVLKRLHDREADAKLSKAALETLAIIA